MNTDTNVGPKKTHVVLTLTIYGALVGSLFVAVASLYATAQPSTSIMRQIQVDESEEESSTPAIVVPIVPIEH